MQLNFFLISVRQLPQMLVRLLIALLPLSSSGAPADQDRQAWQSPLLQQHPLVGQIIDTRTGSVIAYQDLLQQLNRARFVLIGEKHDNPDHHSLQHTLLKDLLQRRRYDVVLEMLDEHQSPALAPLHTHPLPSDALLRQQLDWDTRGWPWEDYGAIIRLSLSHAGQLRSGNLSRATLMSIYREPDASQLDGERFRTFSAISDTQATTIREQVFASHCGTLPMAQTAPMAKIQIARDASMAYAMTASALTDSPAILIAGAFHTRQDLGVPAHLRAGGYSQISVLRLAEVGEDKAAWADYMNAAQAPDFIWFTPKFSDKDYCASLRQQRAAE